jgi:hypothetical protein
MFSMWWKSYLKAGRTRMRFFEMYLLWPLEHNILMAERLKLPPAPPLVVSASNCHCNKLPSGIGGFQNIL